MAIEADGGLTDTPPDGIVGAVASRYTIGDGRGGTATAEVTVAVKREQ